jgi:hypothetical protein
MSSWGVATFKFAESGDTRGKKEYPISFVVDAGVDERGWVDENSVACAVSYGRYQHRRLGEMVKNLHSSRYTGIETIAVSRVEDTGDSCTVTIYKPKQRNSTSRKDGYEMTGAISGWRWPAEDRARLIRRVENLWGITPVIEPPNSTVPPDMILNSGGDNAEQ